MNAPYVWIPLCLLFLAPFFDPRRPFRMLHLDLLCCSRFGVSHVFFNRGEIGTSVPLVYPVAALSARAHAVARLPGRERGRAAGAAAPRQLARGRVVVLVAFRIGLNVVDSNVIDVGYAGVIGADRIVDGNGLYDDAGFSDDVEHGDTYGPANYLAYVPFEQALPWSGAWDDLPAAHGAALGLRPADAARAAAARPAAARRAPPAGSSGSRSAFAWAAFPYSLFALETNSNDTLVALATVRGPAGLDAEPARAGCRRRAAGWRSGSARRRSSPRWRWRRCSPRRGPSRPSARGCDRRRSSPPSSRSSRSRPCAVPPRRRVARAVRPHARLPGRAAVAVQPSGASYEGIDWLHTVVEGGRRRARAGRGVRSPAAGRRAGRCARRSGR